MRNRAENGSFHSSPHGDGVPRKLWNLLLGSGRGTRRMDKLQGARNNEAPVLGCIPEIGASRGYKSRGTRPLKVAS